MIKKKDIKLILDLDETLISYQKNDKIVGDLDYFYFENEIIIKRPFLDCFLSYCFSRFSEVYISTRMDNNRCIHILNHIDFNFDKIRSRKDCYELILPYQEKEIRKKSFKGKAIWVDDSPEFIDLNDDQIVIKAEPFDGDIVDSYLLNLIKALEKIRKKRED